MKTQVIQLEKHDDYISILDKMNWNQAGRILLVLPKTDITLFQTLDLTLIKRYARKLGARVAMVTVNPRIRLAARQAGIPVFENILLAQQGEWQDMPDLIFDHHVENSRQMEDKLRALGYVKRKPAHRLPLTRIILSVLAALALIAIGIYILPGARQQRSPHRLPGSSLSQPHQMPGEIHRTWSME